MRRSAASMLRDTGVDVAHIERAAEMLEHACPQALLTSPRQPSIQPQPRLRRIKSGLADLQDPSADTDSTRASSPPSRAVGDGGQPGIWRSTGSTADTPPAQA